MIRPSMLTEGQLFFDPNVQENSPDAPPGFFRVDKVDTIGDSTTWVAHDVRANRKHIFSKVDLARLILIDESIHADVRVLGLLDRRVEITTHRGSSFRVHVRGLDLRSTVISKGENNTGFSLPVAIITDGGEEIPFRDISFINVLE